MRSTLRILAIAGVFSFLVTIARGDSEIVIAIRYLQADGISHSHLYLYREDGKLLRSRSHFARSALGVRCVFASLFGHRLCTDLSVL